MKRGRGIEQATPEITIRTTDAVVAYPPTAAHPEGVTNIVPIQPMFSDAELDTFHKRVEIERGIGSTLKGFSLEQLARLETILADMKQEKKD